MSGVLTRRMSTFVVLALFVSASVRAADPPASAPTTVPAAPSDPAAPAATAGDPARAFLDVTKVLQSPRCVNCHPNGDAPKVGDHARVHPMDIRRGLERVGMSCGTCHRSTATLSSRGVGQPPAVTHWGLPPAAHPMVFEGKTPRALCEQLKDPAHNGGKDASALVAHVAGDALVLYGWDPGGKRSTPPLSHEAFVKAFVTWANAGMPCPP